LKKIQFIIQTRIVILLFAGDRSNMSAGANGSRVENGVVDVVDEKECSVAWQLGSDAVREMLAGKFKRGGFGQAFDYQRVATAFEETVRGTSLNAAFFSEVHDERRSVNEDAVGIGKPKSTATFVQRRSSIEGALMAAVTSFPTVIAQLITDYAFATTPNPIFVILDGQYGRCTASYAGAALPSLASSLLGRKSGLGELLGESLTLLQSRVQSVATQENPELVHFPLPGTDAYVERRMMVVRHPRTAATTEATEATAAAAATPVISSTHWDDGACVLALTIDGDNVLHTAWAGDCEALIVSEANRAETTGQPPPTPPQRDRDLVPGRIWPSGTYVGRLLSQQHLASIPCEKERVLSSGREQNLGNAVVSGYGRVLNRLTVSRALGHPSFRGLVWNKRVATSRYALRRGDRYVVLMTDGVGFGLAASASPIRTDGLWPVPYDRTLVWAEMLVRQRYADEVARIVGGCDSAQSAADALWHHISRYPQLHCRDYDNSTAIVIDVRGITEFISAAPTTTHPARAASTATTAAAAAAPATASTNASASAAEPVNVGVTTVNGVDFNNFMPIPGDPPPQYPSSQNSSPQCSPPTARKDSAAARHDTSSLCPIL
jgi:hypothetical protein